MAITTSESIKVLYRKKFAKGKYKIKSGNTKRKKK